MKAICPKDPTHDRFVTVAHVTQDWEVDSKGNFINSLTDCNDVLQPPCVDNIWTCSICGGEATVE